MNKTAIYKYPFAPVDSFAIDMPAPAEVLHVDCQRGQPCMWVLVWPDGETVTRRFRLVGTGHEFDSKSLRYLATFQQSPFVWHLFEEP